jgi:hypothetical protein
LGTYGKLYRRPSVSKWWNSATPHPVRGDKTVLEGSVLSLKGEGGKEGWIRTADFVFAGPSEMITES